MALVRTIGSAGARNTGRAHGEVFAQVRPLMTMVEVSALIDPRMLVEIEAMAVAGGGEGAK